MADRPTERPDEAQVVMFTGRTDRPYGFVHVQGISLDANYIHGWLVDEGRFVSIPHAVVSRIIWGALPLDGNPPPQHGGYI